MKSIILTFKVSLFQPRLHHLQFILEVESQSYFIVSLILGIVDKKILDLVSRTSLEQTFVLEKKQLESIDKNCAKYI